ncbi:MAG: hypothetical protein GX197_08165 [Firmicutes bacterium]|nr:hypothetical protein [Bacillota bacterium]
MSLEFFDPTGGQLQAPQVKMAKRFRNLQGLSCKILDNTKQNSKELLLLIGSLLHKEFGITVVDVVSKFVGSAPAKEEELAEAIRDVDFVLVGTGD